MKHLKKFNESIDDFNDEEPTWNKDLNELKLRSWEFSDAIGKCIDDNCKEIPYEGTEIDKNGIREDIINWLESNNYKIVKK